MEALNIILTGLAFSVVAVFLMALVIIATIFWKIASSMDDEYIKGKLNKR